MDIELRVGDEVRIRSQAEILPTLDEHGCFEGLPFMPQMLSLCGRRFRVVKRAHKLCDTTGGRFPRRMTKAVFLDDVRCDGQAYGGCEMDCRIVWKEAWLERVGGEDRSEARNAKAHLAALDALVLRSTRVKETDEDGPRVYRCQATEMPRATTPQSVWDLRQYVEDLRSGNARPLEVVSVLSTLVFDLLTTLGIGLGSAMKSAYDFVQWLRGGTPYPYRPGRLPKGARTPSGNLALKPGEYVRIKSYPEILGTVTEELLNRGMGFSAEMVPFCGETFKVGKRLTRLINEKNGQLLELKNECVILEGASCRGRYARPFLCPRGMAPYWREVWLERTEKSPDVSSQSASAPKNLTKTA